MTHVSGIILAAGISSRLGRPKQLLILDGRPLIRIVAEHALSANLDDLLVVVGHRGDEVASAVSDLDVSTVLNPLYAEGQSSSLHAGIQALRAETDAALFLLSDQPEIGGDTIESLASAFRDQPRAILRARYGEIPGHPVLIGRTLFPELLETSGDDAAKPVLKRHLAETGWVDIQGQIAPGDVDTEADYEALRARWAARRG